MAVIAKHGNWEKIQNDNCLLLLPYTHWKPRSDVGVQVCVILFLSTLSPKQNLALDLISKSPEQILANRCQENKNVLFVLHCNSCPGCLMKESFLKSLHTCWYLIFVTHLFHKYFTESSLMCQALYQALETGCGFSNIDV